MRILLIITCWVLLGRPAEAEDRCLSVAMVAEQAIDEVQRPVVEQLYREAGLCVHPVAMALQRSQELLLRGRIDAEIGRTKIWIDRYKGRVAAVPTPLAEVEMVAFWVDGKAPEPAGPSSLHARSVAGAAGTAWVEDLAAKNGASSIGLYRLEAMAGVLSYGRVDYVLVENVRYRELWPKLQATGLPVRHKVIGKIRFYHVLALKNADLVPQLDTAIKRLGGPALFDSYLARLRPDPAQRQDRR